MSYSNFTSLPPDQESTFVVYEQRTQESSKTAMKAGIIAGAIFFVLTLLIVFSHDKPKNLMADDDMGQLASEKQRETTREELKEKAPAAPAAPAETAPAETAPAEAAPAEAAAPAAPAASDEDDE
ncbi:MAG TPA: hypothetical protein VML75_23370 [Kofleriaceae bacterium]|nr:hypothetical protein [Kofleriaceae bacterium]